MKSQRSLLYLLVLTPLLFTVLIQNSFSEITEDSECREGYVLVFRTNVSRYACVFDDTAAEWESMGVAEINEEVIPEKTPEETPEEVPEEIMITNFEECVAAGNPVMESFPRQCNTADGQNFVEEIEITEEAGVYPDTMDYTTNPVMVDQAKGYAVTEIADGLYWLVGAGYQTMFLTTGEGVIAVDAPQPIGENYLKAISEVTEEPVVYMVYTHSHQDHTGSAKIFANATFVSHAQAADALITENDTNRPVPTKTFDDSIYTISLGNQTLELHYIGNFHSPGDLVIYAPSQKVLMIDDLMRPGESPYKAFGVTPDIDLYLQTHDTLLNDFDFDVLISGHTNILGTADDVTTNKMFTLDVMQNAEDALVAGDENPEQTCASVSIEQWNQTLANLDAFMIDHCLAMIEYLSTQDSTNKTETVEPEDPFSVRIPLDEELTDLESVSIPVPDDDTKAQVKRQLDLLTFKIEQMVELAENQDIIDAVIASNNRFAAMKDANAYISEKDQEWLKTPKQETSAFMAAILQSGVSDMLRSKTSIPTQEYGNVLFPEIIVTNSYGANVGISKRTDDYNQADEAWWINGKKMPIHLREVAWDQSAEIFSSDIIIKIVDENGKFIGMLKAVTPIRDV